MEKQKYLLSNGKCPICGKKLIVFEQGRKIWKTSVIIEDNRDNKREIKCRQCNNLLIGLSV